MVTISVIVPVYNVAPYLHRCVDSILNQTFTDFELILVNDGSQDNGGVICDEYVAKDNRITVIHQKNRGPSSARNAGLEMSKGKYIMFVDSDDMIHSKTLETQISLLEENSADCVICPLQRFSNMNEIDTYSKIDKSVFSVMTGIQAEKGFYNNPNAGMYVSPCSKLFKRELFDNIRFPEGRLFEDEFTTYKVYFKCDSVIIFKQPLYYYFVNNNGTTQNLTLNKRFDSYDAQYGQTLFFKGKNIELYHLSLLNFLKIARWDIIACQSKKEDFDIVKGQNFQKQYKDILNQAKKEKIVSFLENYDYYVLAYPKQKLFLRVLRLILKTFNL